MFDKNRGETVGFLLGAPMLAELFAPRACSLLWRLRPWWPSGLSTYAVFWRGLFLLAPLGMQRSRAVVLFSALCRLRQGFSPSKKVFTCLVFRMLMNDSHQGVILVLSRSCPQFTLLLLAVQALRETTSCSIPGDLTRWSGVRLQKIRLRYI